MRKPDSQHEDLLLQGSSARVERLAFVSLNAFSLVRFKGGLIAELVQAGIQVYALAPDHDSFSREQLASLGAEAVDMRFSRSSLSPWRSLAEAFHLSRLLRRLRVDTVFTYFMKPVIIGTAAAVLAGVKSRFASIEGMGYFFTDRPRLTLRIRLIRAVLLRLLRMCVRLNTKTFFLNRHDSELVAGRSKALTARITHLAGVGVDLDHFAPVAPPAGPVTFVMVARLLREKGVWEFIRAAKLVKRRHRKTRFLLVGGGDTNPGALLEKEVQCRSDGAVECTGHVDEVRPYLACSSVFVLPSHREGSSRSVQEAMAMGRAVVTTTAPGCAELIEEGVNGYAVPVGDAEALAAAMLRFVEKPEVAAEMGVASRRIAEQRFDASAINREILGAMLQ